MICPPRTRFHPTRRGLLGLLAGVFWPGRRANGTEPGPLTFDRLLAEYSGEGSVATHRRYRAHATVTLLSLPVWSRRDVGGACVTVEERSNDGRDAVVLQFAAGSWPERVAGLNRLGVMQEVAVARGSQCLDAAYFGFITSSEEMNIEQGRRAVGQSPGKTTSYVASQGTAGSSATGTKCRLDLPSSYRWTDWREVAREVRRALASGVPLPSANPPEQAATFLYTIRRAILDPAPRFEAAFVHNGKVNRLRTEKSPDLKRPGGVRLSGAIRGESGQSSSFKIWLDEGSALPTRIEYRPRTFLHLVFEQDQRLQEPPITLFLNKETA